MVDKNLMNIDQVEEVNDSDMMYAVKAGTIDARVSVGQLRDTVAKTVNGEVGDITLKAGTNVSIETTGVGEITINSELSVVRTPVPVSPLTGAVDVSVTPTLAAGVYGNLYGVARQHREFQVDVIGGDFSSPVRSVQVDSDSWTTEPSILDNTEFKWRCRDVDVDGEVSGWSEVQSFTTLDIYVVTPIILSPAEGGELPETGQPITASAFQMVNSGDTHAASYWTIKDSLGAVVYQTGRDTVNLTSWQPPAGGIVDGESMTVDVVYESSGGLVSEAGVRGFVGVGVEYDKYLAVAHATTPFVTTYSVDVDDFTKLANPSVLPAGTGRSVAFSPDGTHMAVTNDRSPFITIYKREGDTFTKLANPSVLPTNNGQGVAFSPDGTHMAVSHWTSPFITIYKREGDTFTKADPSVLPTGNGQGVAFSPDGTYLAVAHNTNPFVTIYKRSGDTFEKLNNPDVLPTGQGTGVAFSQDGTHMAVAHSTSPFITIYKREGDAFTKLANPSVLPTGTGQVAAFWPSSLYPST